MGSQPQPRTYTRVAAAIVVAAVIIAATGILSTTSNHTTTITTHYTTTLTSTQVMLSTVTMTPSTGSTSCVQGPGGAPCPSTSTTSSSTSLCTIIYPAGESWTYLRVVYDSNQTPVAGAQVTVTYQGTAPTCYGSSATTTEGKLTLTTNSTEWNSLDISDSQVSSYSIVVTYSGHSYTITPSGVGPAETATCVSLYIPSGTTNFTTTAEFQPTCPQTITTNG